MRKRTSAGTPDWIPCAVLALLQWFGANARKLPWRLTRDPYAIWVSEIMLQQTQVVTVIPYWNRWMRALPTIQSVAKAPSRKIHKLWEGLGYYTRVRNLQKAAQAVVSDHAGQFPENFDDILALPGIGRYTAGAIASIAFNQPRPILDGNVVRVLTRLCGIESDPRERQTNIRLWQLADLLVQHAHEMPRTKHRIDAPCSALNQSLMELGARICTPRSPSCDSCPVNTLCAAFKLGRQAMMPNLAPRPAILQKRVMAFVVERQGKFLVRQRPSGVVNAQLWEFPNHEITSVGVGEPEQFRIRSDKPLCTIKHSITRHRITLEAWPAILAPGKTADAAARWLTPAQLRTLPFTSAHKKILMALRGSR